MSLRTKTIIIVSVTLGALLLVMYVSSRYFLLDNFVLLEKHESVSQVNRAENALNEQQAKFDTITVDWAAWDDTYAFISDVNPAFIESNLNDANFNFLNIDIMLFYDNSGNLVYQATRGDNDLESIAASLDATLRAHKNLIEHNTVTSVHSGLLRLPSCTLLISSRPILKSSTEGPIRGTLVTARSINTVFMKQLSDTTRLDLHLTPYITWTSGLSVKDINRLKQARPNEVFTRVVDGNELQGYKVLNDMNGKPVMVISVDLPRDIYQQGITSMYYFLISLLVIGLVSGTMAVFWLEWIILKRLSKLSNDLQHIQDMEHVSIRMDVAGNDEISTVGESINNMLAALEQAHAKLMENDLLLHRITDNMLDTLALVNLQGIIQYCSPSFFTNLGYQSDQINGHSVYELIHPDDREGLRDTMREMVDRGFTSTAVCRILHAQGHYIWMESTASLLKDPDSDQITGIVVVSRDITQRKAAEDSLIYLSEHDPMTNLYNRMFFRQNVTYTDRKSVPDFGAICCDLNGLRLINDTMGYQTGDAMIVAIAEILTLCTPDGALLARTGGDEFTIFIPNADAVLTDSVCQQITKTIEAHNEDDPDLPLSLSVGFATGTGSDSIQEKLIEAAGNMYRDKLHQHTSGRSAIVATLMQALQERDFITSGHADRMEKLVANMGTVCKLSSSQINDLRLLARFHDIGKVGVKDSLLFKTSKLTAEEHKEMQRHCEIGYRIAQSAPHLRHISEWILKHHEWWNGEGYPLGLKGEEIPKECRILAIADAYDAMTSDRPYRKRVNHEEALEELRRYAGTQFDPWLTVDFICMWQSAEDKE